MRKNKIKSEVGIDIFAWGFALLVIAVTIYPIIYIFSMSISNPGAVLAGRVRFLPIGFDINAYKMLLKNPEVWQKYYNTLWIVIIGTSLSIILTISSAYALSRKEFTLRNFFMIMITLTMFFSGGIIPLYVQVKNLGLINTRWSLVLPLVTGPWFIIIARTYLLTIPSSIIESARADGANEFVILLKLVTPMAKPIVAVIALFAAVQYWNSWFFALLFITDKNLHPIQYYLVRILVQSNAESFMKGADTASGSANYNQHLQYAIIIITILPIMCVYPFAQKYFVKGMLVGSIKG